MFAREVRSQELRNLAAQMPNEEVPEAGDLHGPVEFFVRAFGATADDGSDDDTLAIQATIDAAIEFIHASGKPASVVFDPLGEYRLNRGRHTRGYLNIDCLDGGAPLTLEGNGAILIAETARYHVFDVEASYGVELRDFTIDLDPLPYASARVSEMRQQGLVVVAEPFPGSTDLAQFPSFTPTWGWLHDPEAPGRPKLGAEPAFRPARQSQPVPGGPITFEFERAVSLRDFEVGDALTFHYRRGNNFRLRQSGAITLRNVTSYASGLFFVATQNVNGLSVENCSVLVKAPRLCSTNGDGVHLKYCRDVRVAGNYFEGLSDDGVNVSATFGFEIVHNVFVNKRRHAIVLDTDGVMYGSRSGRIARNVAMFNGGAFIYHEGGNYASVAVFGNATSRNHISNLAPTARTVQLQLVGRSPADTLPAPASLGREDGADQLRVGVEAASNWLALQLSTPRGRRFRLQAIDGLGTLSWTYLGGGAGGRVELRPSAAGDPPNGTDTQLWVVDRVRGGRGAFRLRHESSGLYLTASPGSGGTGADAGWGGVELRPLAESSADAQDGAGLQLWRWLDLLR